jgi:hypothetical protein
MLFQCGTAQDMKCHGGVAHAEVFHVAVPSNMVSGCQFFGEMLPPSIGPTMTIRRQQLVNTYKATRCHNINTFLRTT